MDSIIQGTDAIWERGCLAEASTWTEESGFALFANERDGRVYRISDLGFGCDSDGGNKQVGLDYSRNGLFFCAVTGTKIRRPTFLVHATIYA